MTELAAGCAWIVGAVITLLCFVGVMALAGLGLALGWSLIR